MIIFDTLSELESYECLVKDLRHVITIMDRSLPYGSSDGVYSCAEKSDVKYAVSTSCTSPKGEGFEAGESGAKAIVTLDGEQIVSSEDGNNVFILSEGRFLLVTEGKWKMSVISDSPRTVRSVVFTLPPEK